METPFAQFALVLSLAALLGSLGLVLSQPLIVAFLVAGVLVGPVGLDIAVPSEQVEILSSLGVSILLFLVGIRLDPTMIRTTGSVALATGLGQVAFTTIVGFSICLGLGFSMLTALYVAVALTFSSTIIIVKLLSDKREIDSLHGRIAVGLLIVQDLVVVVVMILLSAAGAGTGADGWSSGAVGVALKGLGMLVATGISLRVLMPRMLHFVARYPELLILSAIAWAVAWAALAELSGLSKEVGAFLAGITMSAGPYRDAIGSRLVPLRDFLLLFFFIDLGNLLDLGLVGDQVMPALILSVFVLVGNPLIVMAIMGFMGYRKRTGFLTGLTVAQISEFSLILVALGVNLGHIESDVVGLVTLVGLITISTSSYMITYSHRLYDYLSPLLGSFERERPRSEGAPVEGMSPEVIVFGLGRYGGRIMEQLSERGVRVLGIDFDPDAVFAWRGAGYAVQYGDAEDPEFEAALPLPTTKLVVCAVPQLRTNLALLHGLRHYRFGGTIVCTAHHMSDRDVLAGQGAGLVLLPFEDASSEAVDKLVNLCKS